VNLAHAPFPANDSERLLFRQLYPNLVRLDCQGVIRAQLAETWSFDSAGGAWAFTLKDTTLSSDGSPLTASQVLGSWRRHPGILGVLGIDSVIASNARTLLVGVRERESRDPRLFARPALSVTLSSGLSLVSNGEFLSPSGTGPTVLEFVTVPGDLRDALDSGVDLLVTRDLELAEYAARQRDLQTFPLPWSRTYVLVQPAAADSLPGLASTDPGSLAQDAVKAESRPAVTNGYSIPCTGTAVQPTSSQPSPRVAYQAADPVARGLAERIVALSGGRSDLRVEALTETAFADALRSGTRLAYIVGRPSGDDLCIDGVLLPPHASIRPLIETRARAIVRRGSPELTVDWDGTPRLAGPVEATGGQ
jgi:hypothetical protein